MTACNERVRVSTPRTRTRFRREAVRLLLAALAGTMLPCSASLTFAGNSPAPRSFPMVALNDLAGSQLPVKAWLEGKPALVNIWATWCPPCRTEMPSLQVLGNTVAPEGIRVVTLSVDTDHNLVREFVLKYRITLPTGIASSPVQAMASLDVTALPVTLYVDAGGRILGRHTGQRDWAEKGAISEVRQRLLTSAPP